MNCNSCQAPYRGIVCFDCDSPLCGDCAQPVEVKGELEPVCPMCREHRERMKVAVIFSKCRRCQRHIRVINGEQLTHGMGNPIPEMCPGSRQRVE